MRYVGRYINLDRGEERRATLEAHLASLNPPQSYRRLAAVDGAALSLTSDRISPGSLGCYHSHRAVLREHLDDARHLHILEDDARLAKNAPSFLDRIISSDVLDEHDILFTDSVVPPHAPGGREFRRIYRNRIRRANDGTAEAVDTMLIQFGAGTSSYLVNRTSIRRLHDLLDAEIERGPQWPMDLQIRQWCDQRLLRVACLFPFITTVRVGAFDSAIDDGRQAKSRLAHELLRYSYFVERDIGLAQQLADRYLIPSPITDLWERLHIQIAGFNASDDYEII